MPEVLAPHLAGESPPEVVFFEPHHDDVVLFSCYALMSVRHATVKTVLGTAASPRGQESRHAIEALGLKKDQYEAWPIDEDSPDWAEAETRMQMVKDEHRNGHPLIVFAPAVEEDGHEHHNAVGELAQKIFGDLCVFYLTYRRGHARSRSDTEVIPTLAGWRAKKLAALSCYASQIDREDTRPWFCSDDVLREWIKA